MPRINSKIAQICLLCFFVCISFSCSRSAVRGQINGKRAVKLSIVEFGGHRYTAEADFNADIKAKLMVHGSANMFLMLTHKIAEEITGEPVKKIQDYGYSSKGLGLISVPKMHLGNKTYRNIPKVPVFDWPAGADSILQGMLGVSFLVAEKATIDFSRDAMILGTSISEKPNSKLLAEGYKFTKVNIENDRVTIKAYFPSIDSTITIIASICKNTHILHQPLFAGKISMTKAPSAQSPSRTTPDEFLGDSVAFQIEGFKFVCPAEFFNLSEYDNIPAAKLNYSGILPFDWMKTHRAVFDYANRILYFKP